ncbi:MAG: T9SS type A sorting domain-containing protein, partial [Bacteroidota bacterium]|nr:T9SS type A sorting domain-containing protein [Bacteroidota bacterium]MDX5431141.1 T9SS type A sorting domain-containing protein [Bacteroidota bacterium]MDX5469888.1 T9SS type A sorting domain-containing protein [Bacteroidota bacterium]
LPYESKEIDLAFFDWTGAKVGEFECSIIKANGLADGTEFNNTRTSSFALTPQFPEEFQIWFKSNNKGSETTLSVHELDGRVIWSRTDFGPSETTRDTIRLVDGCYYFKITDSKRNGIKFWAIPDGTGSLNLRQMSGQIIQSIDGDFGTDRVVHFTVGHPLGAPEIMDNPEVLVYPNPNSGKLTVAFTGKGATTLRLLSMDGKELERRHLDVAGELQEEWDLSTLPTGIYLMEYQGPDGRHIEKIVKE